MNKEKMKDNKFKDISWCCWSPHIIINKVFFKVNDEIFTSGNVDHYPRCRFVICRITYDDLPLREGCKNKMRFGYVADTVFDEWDNKIIQFNNKRNEYEKEFESIFKYMYKKENGLDKNIEILSYFDIEGYPDLTDEYKNRIR